MSDAFKTPGNYRIVPTLQYTTTDERYQLCKAKDGDAGYDLHSAKFVELCPGDQVAIETPFCVMIPRGHVGFIKDRSGIASNRCYTHAGVIDNGYRGRVKVLLENGDGDRLALQIIRWIVKRLKLRLPDGLAGKLARKVTIEPGDRIAQLVIIPPLESWPVMVKALPESERGVDGFGSTGK